MPIIEVESNLLESDCIVIAHQANCQITMGSGIALSIKQKFPEAYEADKSFFLPKGFHRLGYYSMAWSNGKQIYNMYCQNKYGLDKMHTDYDAVHTAFTRLYENLSVWKTFPKVGIPYKMGCVRGGGHWDIYSQIINEIFRDQPIYAYKMADYK